MNATEISWSCAGHSATGGAHIQTGSACQDFFTFTTEIKGRRIVAIADGAGSAKFCQTGARLAAETITTLIASHSGNLRDLSAEIAMEFGKFVRNKLIEKSIGDENEVGAYACTLLAAAFEDNCSIFWQVGDGAWIVETAKGSIECATWPYKGEFNNQTVFITSTDWEDQDDKLQFVFYDDAVNAMGFTDGLEMFCLDTTEKKPHLPFVERIFSVLRKNPSESEIDLRIKQMLASSVITEREDDDLTLVLAWKHSTNATG